MAVTKNGMVRTYIQVNEPHLLALREMALKNGTTASQLIASAVADVVHNNIHDNSYTRALIDGRSLKDIPPMQTEGRPTITYVGWSSVYYSALNTYVPKEWHEILSKLAADKGRSPEWMVRRMLRAHITEDQLEAMADERGVPTTYLRRELLMHLFPELPYCDFSRINIRKRYKRKIKTPVL